MIGDQATFVNFATSSVTSLRLSFLSGAERLPRGCNFVGPGLRILRMTREKTIQQVCTFEESILQQ